jgi:hypothetical protein
MLSRCALLFDRDQLLRLLNGEGEQTGLQWHWAVPRGWQSSGGKSWIRGKESASYLFGRCDQR